MLVPPPGEQARLDAHFVRTLSHLHSHPPARLGASQSRARARHLERLDAYRQRSEFPKNRRFLGRALPHFIDESGTRCAMAHLIESGRGALPNVVRYVARERNFARIHALADIPELALWLEANGLTLEEAAMIQPTYCFTPADNCVCGLPSLGMVRGVADESGNSITVDVAYTTLGVKVGDVLPLSSSLSVPVAAQDIVFATVSSAGTDGGVVASPVFAATDESSLVVVSVSGCSFPQSASIPGPVSYDVLNEALFAGNPADCSQVLATYNPAWKEVQGPDCEGGSGAASSGSSSSGGCSTTGGAEVGTGAIVLLSTALVLHVMRRRRSVK